MVQVGSKLRVSDNSGAKYVSCIKVLGGYKKRYARIGDKLVVSVVSLRAKRRSQSKIQKGKVTYGIVVRTKVDKTSKASRSEEHTSELQSLMRISYAVFCLKNKKH